MQSNFIAGNISKTHIRADDYAGEKAIVLSRIISSKMVQVTIQDSSNIEEYPRANFIVMYFDVTDEMFVKISDRPNILEED